LGLKEIPAEEQAVLDRLAARLGSTLGDREFRRLVDEGATLSFDEAKEAAIRWLERTPDAEA